MTFLRAFSEARKFFCFLLSGSSNCVLIFSSCCAKRFGTIRFFWNHSKLNCGTRKTFPGTKAHSHQLISSTNYTPTWFFKRNILLKSVFLGILSILLVWKLLFPAGIDVLQKVIWSGPLFISLGFPSISTFFSPQIKSPKTSIFWQKLCKNFTKFSTCPVLPYCVFFSKNW